MNARLIFNRRVVVAPNAFAELVLWDVRRPIPGSAHSFKYRLAYVVDSTCVLRYDNESGKGGHKHIDDMETPYEFTSPAQLVADFWEDVERWQYEHRDT